MADVCRKMGVSQATFDTWRKQYGGLNLIELRELRRLREENGRLSGVNCSFGPVLSGRRRRVVQRLVATYLVARKIHLVMDNLNIHCCKSLIDHLGAKEGRYVWRRLEVHYTPTHGSWLNQAEIELSLVSRQCLGTLRILNLENLTSIVRSWNTKANRDRTCIGWKFSREDARTKFGHILNLSNRSQT